MELFGRRRPELTRSASGLVGEHGVVIGAEGDDPFVRESSGTGRGQCRPPLRAGAHAP